MPKRNRAWVADCRGEGRLKHFTGVKPDKFLALAIFVIELDYGERLKRSSKAAFGLFGGARNAANFSFQPGKQRDQQVGLAQRVGPQHDRFGLS